MTEIYTDNYMKELKQTNWKQWAWLNIKLKVKNAAEWAIENPELAGMIAGGVTLAVKTGVTLSKNASRNRALKAEIDHRELDIYDRSLGIYYRMKRKPTTVEYGEISRRKAAGEDVYTILNSLRLL